MILEVVQSKWSLTWYDPLGPRMCVLELMNGHVLQTLREQLKVPGSRLEGSELLTSEFLRFRSRLNETSGGLGKIGAVSGSDCRILKFLRTAFLAAKLLGWKVSVKGIRSSRKSLAMSKPVSGYLSLQHSPFLLTFFNLSTPLYTGTLNISFVHHFLSITQSETPSLRAFPWKKRLLI